MIQENLVASVNKNYLDKVMDLAETADVFAIEDIFSAHKMKLVSKGAKISRAMQEKLVLHKLSQPLESSIDVEGGIDVKAVVSEARHISETLEPVARMLHMANTGGGSSTFHILSEAQFGSAMKTMLTIAERGGNVASAHSVLVSLVSVCLAKQIRLSEKDQTVAALAGLFHDIGELYVEPKYLDNKRRLLPHEWRNVAVHPRIGQMLINQLEKFPPAVAQAVSEHHERLDGAGYPAQLVGKNISQVGQVVAVAEMVSGILINQDRPLERAELALKVVPGEHANELVSAISGTLRATTQAQPEPPLIPPERAHSEVQGISGRISTALEAAQHLLDCSVIKTAKAKELLQRALTQTLAIQRAFKSTGLYGCMDERAKLLEVKNTEILFEAAVATREFEWRMRDIARHLAYQSSAFAPDEAGAFQQMIMVLDQGI